jgi:hypothetical protein
MRQILHHNIKQATSSPEKIQIRFIPSTTILEKSG